MPDTIAPPEAPPEAPIVGRVAERHRLDEFVARLPTAPRSLVLVGEAGIGKTVLWSGALTQATRAGCLVLSARPGEDDWPMPGLGLHDLLDSVGGPAAAELLSPELEPATRARQFLELVRSLAAIQPVVLAIDDLQWLDALTSQLVRFALRRLDGYPVAVLATARTWSPAELELPLQHAMLTADLLLVDPMPVTELRDVLATDGVRLTRPELARLHEVAGGNPLFALELGRHWHRGERVATRTTTSSLLTLRIAALPHDARHLLDLLALAGPSHASVLVAAGLPSIMEVLRGPVSALVELDEQFAVRCAHPLIASAARAALDPVRRMQLHADLAVAIGDPVERARHLSQSTAGPDEVIAAELAAAAQTAARRGSAATAAELAAHSARLTPATQPEHAEARAAEEVVYRAGAGQIGAAIELADRLLAGGPAPALRTQILSQRVLLDFAGGERVLRQALGAVRADERQRGFLLDLLGWQLGLFKGRLSEAMTCSEEALQVARASSDSGAITRAASTLSTCSLLAGLPRRELMAEASRSDDTRRDDRPSGTLLRVSPGVFAARQALWDGDLAVARAGFERTYEVAVELGSEFQRPYRLRDLALLEIAAGRLDRADRLVVEGLEAAADGGNDQAIVWLAHPAGLIAGLRGDAAAAGWAAERLERWALRVDEPLRTVTAHLVRGQLAGSRGDWSTALQRHRAGAQLLSQLGYRHPGYVPVLPAAVEAATLAGDADACAALVGQLDQQAAALSAPWADAMAELGRGQLDLVSGSPSQAETVLIQATDRLVGLGYALDALRGRYFAAIARLRAGHRAAARDDLVRCRAGFVDQGLVGWTALADEALNRLQRTPDQALTATERLITTKIKGGLRNREIAAELFVSESTVEAHLTRIYRKLELRGRSELVAMSLPA